MKLYPDNTRFVGNCHAENFRCVEMLCGKPWSWQIDTFGICAVAYCLLHNEYMEVTQRDGFWVPKLQFKRYWQTQLWKSMFHNVLNEGNTPLREIRKSFEDYLVKKQEIVKSLLLKQQNEFDRYKLK
jgi:checkpoint serine/threonine-protein kinase